MPDTIMIEVRGGCVVDVRNLPGGWNYRVLDRDETEPPPGCVCYFEGDISNYACTTDLWQCLTCCEWFCSSHWHKTSLGYCVECAGCEHEREYPLENGN